MKKVLITGCSGYIGSYLSKILDMTGKYEVHGLDKSFPEYQLKKFYKVDISLPLPKGIDEYDTVIHLAAKISAPKSIVQPTECYEVNIHGTVNLIKNLKFNHFMFASTGLTDKMSEPYSISKRCCEDIVKKDCKDYTIFRFYNVIGGSEFPSRNENGLWKNLNSAKNTGEFTLYGNSVRDYIHVKEIVNSISLLIDSPTNSIEHLGSGIGYNTSEIVEEFKKVNNFSFVTKHEKTRDGECEYSVCSTPSKFFKRLYTLSEMVKL